MINAKPSQMLRHPLTLSLGTTAAIVALNFLTGAILAHALGPGDRGLLAIVILAPTLVSSLGSMGIPQAITVETSAPTTASSTLAGSIVTIALLQTLVLVPISCIVLYKLLPANINHTDTWAAYAYSALIPLNLLTLYLQSWLQGLKRFHSVNSIRLSVIVSTAIGLSIAFWLNQLSIFSAVVIYLASNLLACTLSAQLVRGHFTNFAKPGTAQVRRLVGTGLRAHAGPSMAIVYERFVQIYVASAMSATSLGYFVVANSFGTGVQMIGTTAAIPALPDAARATSVNARKALARRWLAVTAVLSVLSGMVLIFTLPVLLPIVFGESFAPAVRGSQLLVAASVLISLNRLMAALLIGFGSALSLGRAELLSFLALGVVLAYAYSGPTIEIVAIAMITSSAVGFCSILLSLSKNCTVLDHPDVEL